MLATYNEVIKMSNEQSFDTLRYANRLKAVGITEKQAEVFAETMAETIDNKLATKLDIKRVDERVVLLEERINRRFERTYSSMKELELRMTIKLGSIMIGSLGALIFLLKLFKL